MEFLYALNEEYYALNLVEPYETPDQMFFQFHFEKFHSPLFGDVRQNVEVDYWALDEFYALEEAFPGVTVEECKKE